MNAADIPRRETGAAMLAGLLATLGAENDRFRHLWANSDERQRRMLLQIGGVPLFLSEKRWDDLSAETRGKIKRRAADLREWLNRVLPDVPETAH